MSSTVVITGNEAAATAAKLARVQVVAAYPITPQSSVVETLSRWVESGELAAEFVTVESEHSALTVCLAASTVGARTFTATSSNGLAYMTEQVWWTAGARLPVVMGCVNRSLAAPWNVLNDQQDSMSVRDSGWIQLYCRDNQEILDTFLQAFRIAEELSLPVMVCYDGFLLSHTVMPVHVPSAEEADAFLPPRPAGLQIVDLNDPRNIGPVTLADPRRDASGVLHGGYMEIRHAHQQALAEALDVIPAVDAEFADVFRRSWGGLTWEHRLEDAEVVLVAAGSLGMELTLAADELRGEGIRAGVLGIRAYRPFPVEHLCGKLVGRTLAIVFDKALSYGYGGPICTDLRAALSGREKMPTVFGTITGLGGRDVTAAQLAEEARAAISDAEAGMSQRRTVWVNLQDVAADGKTMCGVRE
ncbi:pyruvate ferredoxin oxidoreductase [Geomonas sp. RF6]|uniref:pyruvate ferredoxin oxidoreductase n=1 Tax=Geomonas sp. RF6 TaxID=2897342 RepID=UPI001E2FA706|nr:pyruvate ferredoxin oxidoreductase [Geomonas sp. RF6]UFS72087.1 pyruvate ferredoxin oxidoreductase [Geomonas sp. RF6]